MPNYRRDRSEGATWFFTVVAYRRQRILCDDPVRNALRIAIAATRARRPFVVNAWVLLPDHLHCIWTLPEADSDHSGRWSLIKRKVSIACHDTHRRADQLTTSRQKHRESTIWQRRYWEHRIRDEHDLHRHLDYLYFNPVKHGLVARVRDWPYSTFHRDVTRGVYPLEWGIAANELATSGE